MQVNLDQITEKRIEQELKTGRYSTPAEVVSAAMEALTRQATQDIAFAKLRSQIADGILSADRGELSDGDAFFSELERHEVSSG